MNLLKKIFTYGLIIIVSSFGLTLSATASDFSDLLSAADRGNSQAQLIAAKAYMYGNGVPQSDTKAFE